VSVGKFRRTRLVDRPRNAETYMGVTNAWDAEVAVGRSQLPRTAAPRAAAIDAIHTRSGCPTRTVGCPRRTVGRRSGVVIVVAVLDPVVDIALNLIEPPRIGLERLNRKRLSGQFVVLAANQKSIAIRLFLLDRRPAPERRRGSRPLPRTRAPLRREGGRTRRLFWRATQRKPWRPPRQLSFRILPQRSGFRKRAGKRPRFFAAHTGAAWLKSACVNGGRSEVFTTAFPTMFLGKSEKTRIRREICM
jgi:hypothetical protein